LRSGKIYCDPRGSGGVGLQYGLPKHPKNSFFWPKKSVSSQKIDFSGQKNVLSGRPVDGRHF